MSENRDHGPDWSDWGIDHPEESPSCKCGYNGTPEECATDRENRDPRERAEYIAVSQAEAAMADWRPANEPKEAP